MGVERVCSFFNEPQYAGLFFLFNILIAKNNTELIPRNYYFVNLLAGLFTFSFSFYVLMVIYLILSFNAKLVYNKFIFIIIILLFFTVFSQTNLINYYLDLLNSFTSYDDRVSRAVSVFYVLENESTFNLLFGNGINTYQLKNIDEVRRGISSGYLYLIYEFGIVISLVFLMIIILFSSKDRILLFISLAYLFAMPWHKYYFCWYLIILCGLTYKKNFVYKNIDIKN